MNPTSPTLQVSVNGQQHPLDAHATLADLIAHLGHAPNAIATAVDGEFVASADRATRQLRDGDRVVCFQAIVGG